jgi:predicted nucleotide-binding protein
MPKINQDLIKRLTRKLGVSQSRVYALIQESANKNRVRRHIGALLLAGDHGISIQKYASEEDHAELRGITHRVPVAVSVTAQPPARKAKVAKPPKTKENTVFVVNGRDTKLRDAMYEFLGALGLEPQEWGHAIRAARRRGSNPYVNDVVTNIMEQAQAIVVLLSPDDEAKLKDQFVAKNERQSEGRLRGQARPNVIFETGIAVGAHHRKTVMVHVGDVKPFTDVGECTSSISLGMTGRVTISRTGWKTWDASLIAAEITGYAPVTSPRPRRRANVKSGVNRTPSGVRPASIHTHRSHKNLRGTSAPPRTADFGGPGPRPMR